MNEILIKKIALLSSFFSLIVFWAMIVFSKEDTMIKGEFMPSYDLINLETFSYIGSLQMLTEELEDDDKKDYLRLMLPEGVLESDINFVNAYIDKTLTIEIPDVSPEYFYSSPLVGSSNHISDLVFSYDSGKACIELILDSVYEYETYCEDNYLYLKFISPREVYDKIVVVDAGHGGVDCGTIKYGIEEKSVNLDIVLKLKELLDKSNIKVYYTRTEDVKPTYEQRVGLANNVEADLFISIHANGDDIRYSYGTEVLYHAAEVSAGFGSKEWAAICQEEIVKELESRNRGLISGNDIYIIRNAQVPVALVEIGFITNKEEAELLISEEYQKQAAQGIYNAIMRAYEEKITINTQVVENGS